MYTDATGFDITDNQLAKIKIPLPVILEWQDVVSKN